MEKEIVATVNLVARLRELKLPEKSAYSYVKFWFDEWPHTSMSTMFRYIFLNTNRDDVTISWGPTHEDEVTLMAADVLVELENARSLNDVLEFIKAHETINAALNKF